MTDDHTIRAMGWLMLGVGWALGANLFCLTAAAMTLLMLTRKEPNDEM